MPPGGGIIGSRFRVSDDSVFVIGLDRLGAEEKAASTSPMFRIRLGKRSRRDLLGLDSRLRRALLGRLAFVPFDLERLLALKVAQVEVAMIATPGITWPAWREARCFDDECILDTGSALISSRLGALHLTAACRTFGETGIEHARQPHIDAEQTLAGNNLSIVNPGIALAEQTPILAVLEFEGRQYQEPASCRLFRKRAIGKGLGRSLVHHHRVLSGDLACRPRSIPWPQPPPACAADAPAWRSESQLRRTEVEPPARC